MNLARVFRGLLLFAVLTGCAEYGDWYDDDDYDYYEGYSSATAPSTTVHFSDGRQYYKVQSCPKSGTYRSDPDLGVPPAGMSAAAWNQVLSELDRDGQDVDAICRDGRLYASDYDTNVQKWGIVRN
jgi:hypothetical protein